jgi:hypothetical protein
VVTDVALTTEVVEAGASFAAAAHLDIVGSGSIRTASSC